MNVDNIVLIIVGMLIGGAIIYVRNKFSQIDSNLQALESMIPTAEQVAKEVLKVKIPLDQLPPEMQEEINRQNMTNKSTRNPLVG